MKQLSTALLFITLQILFSWNTLAKIVNDGKEFKTLHEHYNNGQYDSAAYYAKNVSLDLMKNGKWLDYLDVQLILAHCAQLSGDLEEAISIYRTAAEVSLKELGDDHSKTILVLANLSRGFNAIGQRDSAAYYADLTVSKVGKSSSMIDEDLVKVYIAVADVRIAKFELDEATGYLDKALLLQKRRGDTLDLASQDLHNVIGIVHYYSYRYDQAIDHYNRSLDISQIIGPNNFADQAKSLGNIGLCYMMSDEMEKSEKHLRESLVLKLKVLDSDHISVVYTIRNLGIVNFYKKDYERAISYLKKSLVGFEKKLHKNHTNIINTLKFLADSYKNLGEYGLAEDYMKRAITCYEDRDEFSTRLATIYADLADIYLKQGRYTLARKKYEQALNVASAIEDGEFTIAYINVSLAGLEKEVGRSEEAVKLYEKNIVIYKMLWGNYSPELAIAYKYLGNLKLKSQNYLDALTFYQKSLNTLIPEFTTDNIHVNPSVDRNRGQKLEMLQILKQKAKTLFKQYAVNEEVKFLSSSLKTCVLALDLIDEIRKQSVPESTKTIMNKHAIEIVELGTKCGIQLYSITRDPKLKEEIFLMTERANSSVLRSMITESKARLFSDIPDSLLSAEKDLRDKMTLLNENLTETKDSAEVQELGHELVLVNQNYESLIDHFESNYPKYYKFKFDNRVVSKDDLMELLSDNNNLVEYQLTDSTLYIFLLNAEGIFIESRPIVLDQLKRQIYTFKEAILNGNQSDYTQTAKQLHDLLLAPVEQYFTGGQLTIIPVDNLWEINFDLLLHTEAKSADYKSFDYEIRRYSVSYAYSANLFYHENKEDVRSELKNEVLAFSFTDQDTDGGETGFRSLRSGKLEKLPGAAREVKMISEIYDGKYFFGNSASEMAFKENAGQYSILHLAIHGEVDLMSPKNSKLLFNADPELNDDGQLFASELYNMTLDSDLTVLSACNTGTGRLVNGEGMMSLGRAFTYAGTRSMILTLWEIPDQSSPEIMRVFYRGLKNGLSKDEALRQAKLNYLQESDPARSAPLYWGAFITIGNMKPLSNDGFNAMLIVTLAGLLLLAYLIYMRRRHIKSNFNMTN